MRTSSSPDPLFRPSGRVPILLLTAAVAVVAAPGVVRAGDLYVDVNHPGCGSGNGSSNNPFCSIQVGITATVLGDTVLVMPGTYYENIDFLGKGITVKSVAGPDVTTIDGTLAGSVVTF